VFDVNIEGPISVTPKIIDNRNGTYSVRWEPHLSGDYTITVTYKGVPVAGTPFNVYCRESMKLNLFSLRLREYFPFLILTIFLK
jgi:hypothetical protein